MDTYLEKIELHGFKSFPEKTVIQFHKGITAVIGPNGCGKSNLVDAILWVLGEQRIKNLRGDVNEDLIFSGSASKKPLGMTEVNALFNHKNDGTFIARRFFRSGESKYILNEKFCRNKDIQDALFDLGIGEKSYFIFEQGSVEKMVSLKPTERRVLIEEAAGIVQYLERKKETASKLIIAQQNLDSLEMVLTEKGKRLKELKGQVSFVQKYRSLKNQKNEYLKALLSGKYLRLKKQFDEFGGGIEKLISSETVQARDISQLEESLLKLEQERWNLDLGLKKDQQRLFEIGNEILNGTKENEKSEQRQGFLTQRIAELNRLVEAGRQETSEFDQKIELGSREIKELERALNAEQLELKKLNDGAARIQTRAADTAALDTQLKESLFRLEGELSRTANESGQLEKNRLRLENEIGHKKHLLQELDQQSQTPETDEAERRHRDLVSRRTAAELDFEKRQASHREFRERLAKIDQALIEANREIDNRRSQKAKYQEIKEKLHHGHRPAAGPDATPVPAHEGLLQELIRADKQNHALLESFFFEEMDAPIVADAQAAVAGKIDKLFLKRPRPDAFPAGVKKETGYRGRVKERFELNKPTLKAFFKDGVVADNLTNGIRIFLTYGLDVVTEQGELISRDGLLIRNRQRGILEVVDEIKAIDQQIAKLSSEATRLQADRQKQQKEQPRMERTVAEAGRALDELKEQAIAVQSQLEILTKNRDLNHNRIAITRSEIDTLAKEEAALKKELSGLVKKRQALEQQKDKLNQEKSRLLQESEAAGHEANEQEKLKLQRDHALSLLNEKIESRGRLLKDLEAQSARRQQQSKAAEKESRLLGEEISQIGRRVVQISENAQGLNRRQEELEKQIKAGEEQLAAVHEKIKAATAQLNDRRRSMDELREKKKEAEIGLAGVKKDLFQLEDTSAQELNLELKDIEVDPALAVTDAARVEGELGEMVARLNKMRDSERLNFSAEAEHEILAKDHQFMLTQKEDILKSIADLNAAILKIDVESKESFNKAFDTIRANFLKNFKILFSGGEAELSLTDPQNVLESGLEIQAQPPGKKLQNLRLLSGGEKTLTSLAFLFSLFEYKPSPFCVFDEVDASLDEANIQRFLKFLHQLKDKTQFLIITHNFKTMEEADFLYGISMDEPGISKIYSMKMN